MNDEKIIKRKKAEEFIRFAGLIRKHFEDEGIAMTDYEVGHFAVMFQEQLSLQREELRKEVERLKTVTDWNNLDKRFIDLDDVLKLLGGKL